MTLLPAPPKWLAGQAMATAWGPALPAHAGRPPSPHPAPAPPAPLAAAMPLACSFPGAHLLVSLCNMPHGPPAEPTWVPAFLPALLQVATKRGELEAFRKQALQTAAAAAAAGAAPDAA